MIKYILLGVMQGITEFLPVSSSGHLVIAQRLLGITGEEVALSVVLHLGTILALLIFFFKDILDIMCNKKLLLLIFIVTIITGIIGLSGRDFFEGLFQTPKLVALALIFTGIILILTRGFMHGHRDNFKMKDALILGLTQGIAIVPGISRCGITISTLLFRGFTREAGFRISFLASIPAILGAAILEAKNIGAALKIEFTNFLFGFIFSLLSGLLSLWLLKLVMRKARLYYFGYYCIVVAIITLLFIK